MQRRLFLERISLLAASYALPAAHFGVFAQQPKPNPTTEANTMSDSTAEKVLGIGGFFFRSKGPKALAAWYEQHLGINPIPTGPGMQPWQQQAGTTAFAPFPESTKYFDTSKQFMINFRVANIEKLAAQLKAAGIEINLDPEMTPYGRFAHLHDPEGNPIELWQPA